MIPNLLRDKTSDGCISRRYALAVLSLLIVLTIITSCGDVVNAMLGLTVVDGKITACEGGSPLKGATVQVVRNLTGMPLGSDVTGSDGKYRITIESSKLDENSSTWIHLSVTAEGFESKTTASEAISEGNGAEINVCLELQEGWESRRLDSHGLRNTHICQPTAATGPSRIARGDTEV